ncbi:MAG: hypothetical protein Tsb004_28310 [Allomuricauda sp.]
MGSLCGQKYQAGFQSFQLKDTTRLYKPNAQPNDKLYYRPVDLDVWYPSDDSSGQRLHFEDLFRLFEQRANNYQDNEDYSGITGELAQLYVAELTGGTDGAQLLDIPTNSFFGLEPSFSNPPVIMYLAGLNGMGFENYRVLEKLAQHGFLVVAVWSVGRYPGEMTNQKDDMLQQVYDAEFAIRYLKETQPYQTDFKAIGVLGCSWGGMSSAVFAQRNPMVKAFVSLDGTETHYFGKEDESDVYIQEIHDATLLQAGTQNIRYLYLESGDKLEQFQPTKAFNYYQQLKAEKYYLRFANSTHADFTCIPALIETSENAVSVYEDIEALTIAFFQGSLQHVDTFKPVWDTISSSNETITEPYRITQKPNQKVVVMGVVLDAEGDRPLPYVNVGLLHQEIGTVTDTQGTFTLDLENKHQNDTVRFSYLGYGPKEFSVKDLLGKEQPLSIVLREQVSELNEVVITTEELKKKTLGNKTESKFMSTGFSYDQLGAEMGIKINIRKAPTFVNAFSFHVPYNRLSAKSIFRLNMYAVENNVPKENLLKEQVLITIEPKQTGKIKIDLVPYNIVLKEDVIIALEWVDIEGNNHSDEAIFFSLGLFNSGTLYKKSSQSRFKKHSSMGVGFQMEVSY